MYRLFCLSIAIAFWASCEQSPQKPPIAPVSEADSSATSALPTPSGAPLEQIIAVKPVKGLPSPEFFELIAIAEDLSFKLRDSIRQNDSLIFYCGIINHPQRLVYRGISIHHVYLEEITTRRMKKGIHFEEGVFPSVQEATRAAQKIQAFIYQDSSTNAFDKRPTDIFRYENRIYQLSVGAFNSIPDMKTVCRKFRKILGPSATRIMLWDYYGYGE